MEEWETNQSFQEAKLAVESFPVVNDAAERGVKLCHDFIETARFELKLNIS